MRALTSSGWLPAAILGVLATVVLVAYDTPVLQIAIFAAYVTFGITLPGVLVVRWIRRRPAHIAEDAALGLTVGYTIEVATYIVARAAGAPYLVLAWPITTLLVFAIVPSLRRHWRGAGTRAPVWWSWALAAMLGYLLMATAASFFARYHLVGADTPYVDLPYHLALIGELRNHVPPELPWVSGVPLAYHWFYYAEAAATSWVTGIEPVTLLYRLSGLPMFLAFVILTASAARRLSPGWWTGPVAVAIAMFGTVAGPYPWVGPLFPVFDSQFLLLTSLSPTNLFGLALFSATILVLLDLLMAGRTGKRGWALTVLLIFGIAGAKATLLPLLIVGFLCVVIGIAIGERRLHRPAMAGMALTIAALFLATIILYRGATGGVIVGIGAIQRFPVGVAIGATRARGLSALAVSGEILVVAIALWSFLWAGVFGLLARWRTTLVDPGVLLLIGICAAGLGAATFLLYPGLSELYFLRGAVGAFGLLTATGIAILVPERFRGGPLLAAISVAVVVGAGTTEVIRALTPGVAPRVGEGLRVLTPTMLLPVLALVATAALVYLVARRFEARGALTAGTARLLVLAVAMGFGLSNVGRVITMPFENPGTAALVARGQVGPISRDGIDAARWLRDHSAPDDLVATDLHCLGAGAQAAPCDSRHFWASAYAERRTLVEGWSYTNGAQGSVKGSEPALGVIREFWDPARLAANDAAFSDPSQETVGTLRDRYGVRWLFADMTRTDGQALERVADLQYRAGDYAVFRISVATSEWLPLSAWPEPSAMAWRCASGRRRPSSGPAWRPASCRDSDSSSGGSVGTRRLHRQGAPRTRSTSRTPSSRRPAATGQRSPGTAPATAWRIQARCNTAPTRGRR